MCLQSLSESLCGLEGVVWGDQVLVGCCHFWACVWRQKQLGLEALRLDIRLSDQLLPVPNSNPHLPFWEGYPGQVRASVWEGGLTSGFDLVTHSSAIPLFCFRTLL